MILVTRSRVLVFVHLRLKARRMYYRRWIRMAWRWRGRRWSAHRWFLDDFRREFRALYRGENSGVLPRHMCGIPRAIQLSLVSQWLALHDDFHSRYSPVSKRGALISQGAAIDQLKNYGDPTVP